MNSTLRNIISKVSLVIPDKPYLSIRYYAKFKTRIRWDNPETFSEKMQWLKLYNRKSEYTNIVDKYAVKQYITNIIGGGTQFLH